MTVNMNLNCEVMDREKEEADSGLI